MTQRRRVVLWIGGGSGGHIYPNVAMSQRFAALQRSECADEKPDDMAEIQAHFVVSDRAVDQQVMQGLGLERGRDWTAVEARGFSVRPRAAAGFARGLVKTRATLRALERGVEVVAAVASGGFVSGSVGPSYGMGRGASRGVPMALVSLDAKAGRANRWLARRADQVFSAYDHCGIAGALTIGYPLRDSVMDGAMSAGEARVKLGLDAGRPTLLVFGGSQGGRTLNQAVALAWRGLAGGRLAGGRCCMWRGRRRSTRCDRRIRVRKRCGWSVMWNRCNGPGRRRTWRFVGRERAAWRKHGRMRCPRCSCRIRFIKMSTRSSTLSRWPRPAGRSLCETHAMRRRRRNHSATRSAHG